MMSALNKLEIIVVGLLILSTIAGQIVRVILDIIITPLFGFKIRSFSFFGLLFLKQDGKWKVSFKRLSWSCQSEVIRDLSKPIPEDLWKKEKQANYFIRILMLLFGVFLLFISLEYFLKLFHRETLSSMELFIISFVTGIVCHSISYLLICIYTYQIIIKRLGGYTDNILKKLMKGYSFESLYLVPVEELPYRHISNIERLQYDSIYVYYLVATGKTRELQKISYEMTSLLDDTVFIIQQTGIYYWLVYYYSRYEINPQKADRYLKTVWPVLSMDSDANAKRVLASYYYGIKNDMKMATDYLKEGLACVNQFSIGAERELEKQLLEDLAYCIKQKTSLLS